jgi:hypothetical protein
VVYIADLDEVRAIDGLPGPMDRCVRYCALALNLSRGERPLEALAVLRRATRELAASPPELAQQIIELASRCDPPIERGRWSLVEYQKEPERFKELGGITGDVHDGFWHPGAPFQGMLGVPGLSVDGHGWGGDNVSFHVCRDGELVATVPALIDGTHVIGWGRTHPSCPTMPIDVYFADEDTERSAVWGVVWEHLHHLMRAWGASCFRVQEDPGAAGTVHRLAVKKAHRHAAEIWDRPVVDLSKSEADLLSGVRKSFRSNVNWGRKNLITEYLDSSELTDEKVAFVHTTLQEIIEKYGDGLTPYIFHRPLSMCRQGKGEIAITREGDGDPLAMTMVTYDGGVAYYALGGQRSHGNKHIGHYAVFDALLRAKSHGMSSFVLDRYNGGSTAFDGRRVLTRNDREESILFFKRGFSDDYQMIHVYTVFP